MSDVYRKFASIAEPTKYGYCYDSGVFDHKATVEARFRMFETYGDGLTQHSHDWSITAEWMADYLAALAGVMLTDDELTSNVSWRIQDQPRSGAWEFARSIVYKETDSWSSSKRRYYSMTEQKISSKQSLQHDKRYHEIPTWADGSPMSIYQLCIPENATDLEHYSYAHHLREWHAAQSEGHYIALPAQFLGWFKEDHRKALDLHHAYQAAELAVIAWRSRENAASALANYCSSVVKVEEKQEEEASA